MKILKHYRSFNFRRYGNPWVAKVDDKTAKPDFNLKVGGHTGGYNRGEEGDLYVTDPQVRNGLYVRSERLQRQQYGAGICRL